MKVTVISGTDVSGEHLERWAEIQRQDASLASPFFCPEFTIAAASVCDSIRVGVMEEAGKIVGYFPFQRRAMLLGQPAAYAVSDYQGVIAMRDASWTAEELIAKCKLPAFEFNHLIASQTQFQAFYRKRSVSPIIDVSSGYEAYRKGRREAGSVQLKKLDGLARKLEREIGHVRFELHTCDPLMLQTFIAMKIRHDAEKGYKGVPRIRWIRRLLERIQQTQTDRFGGMLSVLYAGDELVAIHMGMRSETVWHYWMPAYQSEYAKYSPGLILLTRMAQAAPDQGLKTIDLGKGQADYKDRFMNGSIPLAEGRVCLSRTVCAAADGVRKAKMWMRNVRVVPMIRAFRGLAVNE